MHRFRAKQRLSCSGGINVAAMYGVEGTAKEQLHGVANELIGVFGRRQTRSIFARLGLPSQLGLWREFYR